MRQTQMRQITLTKGSASIFEQARLAAEDAQRRRPMQGPGNAAGREEFERLEAAKRYYAFLESKRAIMAGIADTDERLAGMSPRTEVIASSLGALGGGGRVFGGNISPEYQELKAHSQFLRDQLSALEGIEKNTGKPLNMRR